MPGYKTHITWSSIAGVGLGSIAHLFYGVSLPQSIFAGALCSLGGVLPDVDSDTSRAYERCITTISGTCVLLLASRLRDFSLEPEGVVTTCAAVYFFIVYVIGAVVKKLTIHRGMCHSIPFAIIAGELIFILSAGDTELRLFKSFAIVLGVMIHLFLDEANSFAMGGSSSSSSRDRDDYGYGNDYYEQDAHYGKRSRFGYSRNRRTTRKTKKRRFQPIRVKKSFGTAIKLIDYKHMGTTIIFYVVAAFLGHCAMGVQDFLQKMGDVDQAEIQGMLSVNRVKRLYPTQYDLSVVQWVAENNLVLTPGQDGNKKWTELEELLAIGADANTEKSASKARSKSKNAPEEAPEDVVSLMDVINWNSLSAEEEAPKEPKKSILTVKTPKTNK